MTESSLNMGQQSWPFHRAERREGIMVSKLRCFHLNNKRRLFLFFFMKKESIKLRETFKDCTKLSLLMMSLILFKFFLMKRSLGVLD